MAATAEVMPRPQHVSGSRNYPENLAQMFLGANCLQLAILNYVSTERAHISPRLLNKGQAAAYCGISASIFAAVCPVRAIALGAGARLQRYDVRNLDAWIDSLSSGGTTAPRDWLSEMDKNDGNGRARQRH
jgi:hypothetical protein